MSEGKKTDESFWENFWGSQKLPLKADLTFKNDRVISEAITQSLPKTTGTTSCLEVGCAPGRWMIFMAEHFGCKVTGIEYVKSAAEATIKNLSLCNIDGKVLNIDFFNQAPEPIYDIVMSFGFIEHFENPQEVIDLHLKWLKPGGTIIIGIPRFKGINYLIQTLIDKDLEQPLVPAHNLTIMNRKFFKEIARTNDLTILKNDFIGGFERSLFPIGAVKNTAKKFLIRGIVKMFYILGGDINISPLASYQIFIASKKS